MPVLELQRMPSFYMYDPGFSTKQLLQCLLEAPNRFQTSKKADAALDRDVFDRLQDEAKVRARPSANLPQVQRRAYLYPVQYRCFV